MFVVDTNILVYAADKDSKFHGQCCDYLNKWRSQPSVWYITWGIVYEFLRVITHPRVFREPWVLKEAWQFVEAILASSSLSSPVIARPVRYIQFI